MHHLKRRIARVLVPLLAVAFAVGFAAPARAAETPDAAVAVTVAAPADADVIDIDQAGVLLIVGLVLPVIVGAVTKSAASSRLKALTNFVAAGVAAFISNAVDDTGHAVLSVAQLRDWVIVFSISTVTYLGLAKPLDIPSKLWPTRGLGRT